MDARDPQVGLVYAVASMQRGGGPSIWEVCQATLRDIASDADVICLSQPGSYLARRLRAAVHADHLFIHTPSSETIAHIPLPLEDLRAEPRVLGADDVDVAEAVRPWPAPRQRMILRQRSIDTLYESAHRPALIAIDYSRPHEILQGATKTLDRHRPSVVIGLASLPVAERLRHWQKCIDLLQQFGYLWYDGLLLPCWSPERREQLVSLQAGNVVCARVDDRRLAEPPQNDLDACYRTLSANDWTLDVPFDLLRTGQLATPFDDNIPAQGLYPAETDDTGSSWRWSGPTAHVRIRVPVPGAGRWFFRIETFNWGSASSGSDLRLFIHGRPVALDRANEMMVRFGPVPIAQSEATGSVVLDLETLPPTRAGTDDPRKIGVNLSRIVVEREL